MSMSTLGYVERSHLQNEIKQKMQIGCSDFGNCNCST